MPIITRSGVRISTDSKFETYTDTMVSGEQTQITVGTLEPSTTYYAKGLAESGGNIYISDNSIQFKTLERVVRYMTLTATAPNSTVELANYGYNATATAPVIYWSRDLVDWKIWDFTAITLDNIGDEVHFYGENPHGIARNNNDYSSFVMSGQLAAKGDVTSLLSTDGISDLSGFGKCFFRLFRGCTSLTTAPELPSEILGPECYMAMFDNCTSLTTAPALPATTLASQCYENMFSGCTALTTAPTLPATTLASQCYDGMFNGCTSLTTAPTLPATTLEQNCYLNMFYSCTSLATAPALPATTLASGCYTLMFGSCRSLTTAPELPATTLAQNCYASMFSWCTSLTTAPVIHATTLASGCCNQMFRNCTSLTTAPALPATTIATQCYYQMFYNCTALTTVPASLPATTLASQCYYQMFYGCTRIQNAPVLPAATLEQSCYYNMFRGCTALSEVTCLATDISAFNSTWDWLYQVAASGTFYKDANMNDWTTGSAGVPSGWTVVDYVP